MKNDFQLLDLPGLARAYQSEFQQLKAATAQEQLLTDKKLWQFRVNNMVAKLQQDNEAGSDGLEEAALEIIGAFQPQDPKLDLEKLKDEARNKVTQHWLAQNRISQCLSWFAPQMLAYFGSWQAVKVGALYCPKATYEANVVAKKDLFALGAALLAKANRNDFFKDAPKGNQQYKSPLNPLTPIVLSGFKRYQDIAYMAWNLQELAAIEGKDIVDLVGVKLPDLSDAERLRLRNLAITPQSGPRANKPGNPATTASRYHLANTEIGHLPKLAQFMVLQTWAAHPQNRDKYMILNPENWDDMPKPLTGTDVFVQQPRVLTSSTAATADIWEA